MESPLRPTTIDGTPIKRLPMGFSNIHSLKSQGLIGPKKAEKKKKCKHVPKRRVLGNPPKCLAQIPVCQRLAYLKNQSNKVVELVSFKRLAEMRSTFDLMRDKAYPFSRGLKCWVCVTNGARLRHHIIQLKHGGTNRRNNIVPLCHYCHVEIHPHLDISRNEGVASENSVNS